MAEYNTWPGWASVEIIGKGTYGTVYKIQRTEFGKTFTDALKVISVPRDNSELAALESEGLDAGSITAYFENMLHNVTNEIALMSELTGYTNIVSYYDHMVSPHQNSFGWDILIRMELLKSLSVYAAEHPFNDQEIIRLGTDICKALELCEEKKILHRDIKPENIFINQHGDFKLGDFGVARMIESDKTTGTLAGTETYMAPEVYRGEAYGHTADLYSLAMVLYKFLNNNRTPFLPQGSFVAEDREKARSLRMSGKQIPAPVNGSEQLQQVILRALSFSPEKRFPSAAAFRSALENCLKKTDEPQQPLTPEPPPPPDGRDWRRMIIIALSVAAVCAVAGIVVLFTQFPEIWKTLGCGGRTTTEPTTAETPTTELLTAAPQYGIIADSTEIEVGQTADMRISDGTSVFSTLEGLVWSSSNSSVATIDNRGVVTGVYPGTAQIRAEINGTFTEIMITVKPAIGELKADANEIEVGKTTSVFMYIGSKIYTSSAGLIWTSSNPAVATVTSSGVVTGISAGTAKITAELNGTVAEIIITVTSVLRYQTGLYYVDADGHNLNMRKNHSTDSQTLVKIPDKTILMITEIYYDKNAVVANDEIDYWGKCTYGDNVGWVAMSYLTYLFSAS